MIWIVLFLAGIACVVRALHKRTSDFNFVMWAMQLPVWRWKDRQ